MEVHKRCTGFAITHHYWSALERPHGLKLQTTAHSTDCRAPETHELAVLNPPIRTYVRVRIPPRARIYQDK